MTTGSILFGAALLIVFVLYLARPFLTQPTRSAKRQSKRRELLAEKEALMAEIRTIDFEHDTGKLPTEVYQAHRQQLVQRTAAIMKALDQQETKVMAEISAARQKPARKAVDDKIEAAIAQMRDKQPAAPAPVRVRDSHHQGGFCPQCGQPTEANDKFCTACGHQLGERQAVTS